MALEVKELRIGNHVLYEGERVKIDQIQLFGDIGLVDITYTLVSPNDLSPIPITEELLTEFGFEKNNTDLDLDYEKFPKDGLGIFIKVIKENLIRVGIWDNVIKKGDMLCQYLHELETFVFITTKKELLK